MQPGIARFTIPVSSGEAVSEEEEGKDITGSAAAGDDVGSGGGNGDGGGGMGGDDVVVAASLNHKELAKSQVPTLEVGDTIEADIWRSNLGGGKVNITDGMRWNGMGRSLI